MLAVTTTYEVAFGHECMSWRMQRSQTCRTSLTWRKPHSHHHMVAILSMSKVIKLFCRSSSKRSSTIYALTRALVIPVVTRLEHVANRCGGLQAPAQFLFLNLWVLILYLTCHCQSATTRKSKKAVAAKQSPRGYWGVTSDRARKQSKSNR